MRPALLIAFAALIGLFEGPAQIVCVVLLLAIVVSEDRRELTPGVVGYAIGAWILAGIPGTLDDQSRITSEGALRPLLALAFFAGRAGFARADDKTLKRVAVAFVLACVVNGAYGLMQVFWVDPPLERWIAGRSRSAHLIDPLHPERLKMATGLFYNRLKLAHVGSVALGLIGLIALSTLETKRRLLALGAALILAWRCS